MAKLNKSDSRSKFLAARKPQFELAEFEGDTVAIRTPKVGPKGEVMFSAGDADGKGGFRIDPTKLTIAACIACLYTVGEDGNPLEPMFEATDYDALADQEAGGIVDVLGKKCVAALTGLADPSAKAAAKNA